jgi:DivIVA domain-containing protein
VPYAVPRHTLELALVARSIPTDKSQFAWRYGSMLRVDLTDAVFVAIAVAVFAVVAVAADRASALDADPSQLTHPKLPSGEIQPADLESVRFAVVARGYRMDHVDEVIERLVAELNARDQRLATLEARFATPLPRRGNPADSHDV